MDTAFIYFLKIFIYLATLGLIFGMWELLVDAWEVSIVAYGIYFLDQGLNPGLCVGNVESQSLDHQGSTRYCF